MTPGRKPGKKGRVIEPAVPGKPPAWAASLAVNQVAFLEQFANVYKGLYGDAFSSLLGTPGTPARYEPDGPPEGFIPWLIRLSWLQSDDIGRLSLTALGRALLRSEEVTDEGASDALVLKKDDPLAYATLLGRIAEMGQVLVVDPYLKPEQLFGLIKDTNANRFLIGAAAKTSDVVAMSTLIGASGWATRPELRQAGQGQLHDRFIVGDTEVHALGSSMNTVGGKHTTTLMPLPEVSADHIRELMEGIWEGATRLAPDEEPEGDEAA